MMDAIREVPMTQVSSMCRSMLKPKPSYSAGPAACARFIN